VALRLGRREALPHAWLPRLRLRRIKFQGQARQHAEGGMSDEQLKRLSEFEKEFDELLADATPEEKKEIWIAFYEWLYSISDDDQWESIKKAMAKRSAH
jgi:hypothetical protein